jgi:hypothetical protein
VSDNITLRRAAEQARDALNRILDCEQSCECLDRRTLAALDAALAEPVEYRCHADIDDLSGPDSCVLDGGNPDDCMYARRFGKNAREHCGEWKPFIRKEDKP